VATSTGDIRWVGVDGVDTRVLTAGDVTAPPVVLLHGIGGHLEAFDRNLAALARTRRVIAYDLPGHGWSTAPTGRSYEIDGYLAHLAALLDVLELPAADLVGLSLGGWIAGRAAIELPERVRRLVLVAPGGVLADPAVMNSIRTLTAAAAAAPTEQTVRARLGWLMADPATVTDELVATRLAIYRRPGTAATTARVLCLQDPQVRARNLLAPTDWKRVTAPTLVVWGDADATGPAEVGARLAGWLPAGRFLAMPGTGHWPQFEDPLSFDRAVTAFLDETGAPIDRLPLTERKTP
jgi:2-hydroxy-6-oxonona-2,4-dienedioate hydrolase